MHINIPDSLMHQHQAKEEEKKMQSNIY